MLFIFEVLSSTLFWQFCADNVLFNSIVWDKFWDVVNELCVIDWDDDNSSFNVANVKLTVNVSTTLYSNIIGLPFFSYKIDNERSNDEPV